MENPQDNVESALWEIFGTHRIILPIDIEDFAKRQLWGRHCPDHVLAITASIRKLSYIGGGVYNDRYLHQALHPTPNESPNPHHSNFVRLNELWAELENNLEQCARKTFGSRGSIGPSEQWFRNTPESSEGRNFLSCLANDRDNDSPLCRMQIWITNVQNFEKFLDAKDAAATRAAKTGNKSWIPRQQYRWK